MRYFRNISFLLMASLLLASFAIPLQLAMASPESPTRAELEAELKNIEKLIAEYEKQLATTKTQKTSLSRKISQLKTQQAQLRLQIKATAILIDDLDKKIDLTHNEIENIAAKIKRLRLQIAMILRMMNVRDDTGLVEMLAVPGGLTEVFNEIQNYNILSEQLSGLIKESKNLQKQLLDKRGELAEKQDDAKDLLSIKTIQQQSLVGQITQQNVLLTQTKGKEAAYQANLADTKKRAAEIKSRIYELMGGGKQINFGEAVAIGDWVASQTGVRTAFLLAVITQESNLGKNVGTCNRAGDPPEKSWKVIMKPSRDQEPFKTIIAELGKDIDATPVSCPMKNKDGSQLGWGGAMGPAQFIPSTWMGWRLKVAAITGKPANPWDNRDAFLAAGLKLKADGANGTKDGEWKAAMRYFSGSTNTRYRFYGDNVLKITEKYLIDIADLNK